MSLQIVKVHEYGKAKSEYVEITVAEDCDLSYFIVADTTYTQGGTKISNKLRHMHWFSPKKVKKGDTVYLRTSKGTDSATKKANETTTYVIYWGLDGPVWNDDGDGAILLTLKTWKASLVVGSKK